MKKTLLLLTIMLALLSAGTANAALFYVDGTNGNDSNPGTDVRFAKKTIQAALDITTSVPDEIRILPGTYTENLTVNNPYVTLEKFVRGHPNDIIIEGTITVNAERFRINKQLSGASTFYIRNYEVANDGDGVITVNAARCELYRLDFYQAAPITGEPIEIKATANASYLFIEECVIDRGYIGSQPCFALMNGADHVKFRRSDIAENGAGHIYAEIFDGQFLSLYGNTIHNSFKEGVLLNPINPPTNNHELQFTGTNVGNAGVGGFPDAFDIRILDEIAVVNQVSGCANMLADLIQRNSGASNISLDWCSFIEDVWIDDDWTEQADVDTYDPTLTWQVDAFAVIQDGVDAVEHNGTVHVLAGTYEEQVIVNNKDLSIEGENKYDVTVVAPDVLATNFSTSTKDYKCIIAITQWSEVDISGLTVDGAGKGNGNYSFVGIGYEYSGGTIESCQILNVRNTPFAGSQHGLGFYALTNSSVVDVYLSKCKIEGFQKNAATFKGAGMTAHVDGCLIIGEGHTSTIAQNGIQVSGGAKGLIGVTNGNTIQDIFYSGSGWVSTGIMLYQVQASEVMNNYLVEAQVGIYSLNTSAVMDNNYILFNEDDGTVGYGIIADPGDGSDLPTLSPDLDDLGFMMGETEGNELVEYTITNNIIRGMDIANSLGLYFYTGVGYELTGEAHNNDISHFDIGVAIYEGEEGHITSLNAHNNRIYNNSYGMDNGAALIVNAENNWWGDCSGPLDEEGTNELPSWPDDNNVADYLNADGLGNGVSGNIDYFPWIGEENPGDAALWLSALDIAGPNYQRMGIWREKYCRSALDATIDQYRRRPLYLLEDEGMPKGVQFSTSGFDWTHQDAMKVAYNEDVTTGRAALGDPGLVSKSLFVVFTPEETNNTAPQMLFEAGGQYSGFNMAIQNGALISGMWNPIQRLFWVHNGSASQVPFLGGTHLAQLEFVYDGTDTQHPVRKFRVIYDGVASDWAIYYGLIKDISESGVGAAVMGTALRNYYIANAYAYHYDGLLHEVIVKNGDFDSQEIYDYVNATYGTSVNYPDDQIPEKGVWNLEIYENEAIAVNEINVYPNPASEEARLTVSLFEAARVEVAIYDVTGVKVANVYDGNLSMGASEISIATGNLASGTYTVTVAINGKTNVKQLVVIR